MSNAETPTIDAAGLTAQIESLRQAAATTIDPCIVAEVYRPFRYTRTRSISPKGCRWLRVSWNSVHRPHRNPRKQIGLVRL